MPNSPSCASSPAAAARNTGPCAAPNAAASIWTSSRATRNRPRWPQPEMLPAADIALVRSCPALCRASTSDPRPPERRGWPGHRRAEATPSFRRLCPADDGLLCRPYQPHICGMAKKSENPTLPESPETPKSKAPNSKASRPDVQPIGPALAELLNPAINRGESGMGSGTGLQPPPDNSWDRRAGGEAAAHRARKSTPKIGDDAGSRSSPSPLLSDEARLRAKADAGSEASEARSRGRGGGSAGTESWLPPPPPLPARGRGGKPRAEKSWPL